MKKAMVGTVLLLMVALLTTSVEPRVSAESYDVQIRSAQQRKAELERKKKLLKAQVEKLESDKKDVVQYVKRLDKKMIQVANDVESLRGKISNKSTELTTIRKQLVLAKKKEKNQYETMKKRIKYMYENGNTQYMDMLFGAEDVSDFLNRAEYVEKISEYDNNMLGRLKETKNAISIKEKKLSEALEDLKDLKAEADDNKAALEQLTRNKKAEISRYESNISVSNEKKAQYERAMAKQEEEVERLLALRRKAIEAAAKNGDDGSDHYSGAAGFRWPLRIPGRISSYFGGRSAPTAGASTYHKGLDIAVPTGTPIVAVADGNVVTATYSSSAGNYIMIYHGKSTYTVYMHCSRLGVTEGAKVKKGQVIGYVGSTGISTGSHLHFGVSVNGSYVNPLNYVKR